MPTLTPTELMVKTRYGAVYFTTTLEWGEAIEICRKIAAEGNKFAMDLVTLEDSKKFMSQSQCSWVYKLAEDARKEQTQSPSHEKETRVADAGNILASLAEARAKGIKKPVLRLMDHAGNSIRIKYMSMGKNAGGCWITSNSDLVGKIDDGGQFTFVGKPYTDSFINATFEFIEQVNSDVRGALTSFGKITNRCGCCGIELTNPKSIELGIGPICLSKYGLLSMI